MELLKIENTLRAFEEGTAYDYVISEAKSILDGFEHDMTTSKGRKATASLANKIAKLKTAVDAQGKDLVSEWKEKSRRVDRERKRIRDELDLLKVEARAPLTEWERIEAERIQGYKEVLDWLKTLPTIEGNSVDIQRLINEVEELDTNMEEYSEEAEELKKTTLSLLGDVLKRTQESEKQALEIEALKQAAEEKAKEEERLRIEREAKEKAEKEAQRELIEARIKAEQAEKARLEAIERAKQEAIRAEQEKQAAIEKARLEKERLEREKIELEEKARKAAAEAKQAEIRRQLEIKEAEERERLKREQDKLHMSNILSETKESIMKLGLDEGLSKRLVMAIWKGSIKHVSIKF
jgi:hypothetical protein